MTYYPVCIATLNRYEHFKECVESLAACTHADKTEIVIGLDYPPSEKYVEGWKKIKEYLPSIKGFGKVTIFEHDHNLGIGPNGNGAFITKYVKTKYDAWIGTEDDNVFSPCFLDYMDKCLEKYKYDKKVLMICGCLEPDMKRILENPIANMKGNVLKIIGNGSAYGDGYWRDKENFLRTVFPKDIKHYIFSSRKNIIKLLKAPGKLNHIYFWIKKRPELNLVCDFTRNAWMVLQDQVNILPTISLVRNNGFDGSGIFCGASEEVAKKWDEMKISDAKYYNIKEIISERDVVCFSKKLFKSISKKEKKEIFPIIILYLGFGYKISQKLERIYEKIKTRIKLIIKRK